MCSPHQSADKQLTASPLEKPNGRGRHLPSLEKANGGSRELHLNLKQTARRSHVTFGRYVFTNNIPTTRLKSAELEAGVPRGNPLARFLRLFFAV